MNEHIMRGKWKEIRGGLKKQWARLTDDDIRYMQGSLDQLVGVLQQRYGYTKERAEKEIDQYLSQIHDYSENLKDYNQEVQTKVRGAVSQASNKIQGKQSTTEKVKSKGRGWLAIMAGLALFALVFYLFNKQENKSFSGGSYMGSTGQSGSQSGSSAMGKSGSGHSGPTGQSGQPGRSH